MKGKPILCLDFDGVLHSYLHGWQGPGVIPDGPVPGALNFLTKAADFFEIHVFSSRSAWRRGRRAMRAWLIEQFLIELPNPGPLGGGARDFVTRELVVEWVDAHVHFPKRKPPATVGLDDRVIQFKGVWPAMHQLRGFVPWNGRPVG
jgi:hypothetical protein